jgi:hypothetical protein
MPQSILELNIPIFCLPEIEGYSAPIAQVNL